MSATTQQRKTRHLVDPELLPLVENVDMNNMTAETLPQFRAWELNIPEDHSGVKVEERFIKSTNAPDIKLYIFSPEGNTSLLPGYLTIHGGGYVLGAAKSEIHIGAHLARLGIVTVSVEYRLAPEHPKTAAVEDCYAALLWMFKHGNEVNIDAKKIGFGGESAGGGLAAALGIYARDKKEVHPIFQLLVYPMLDDRTCLRKDHGNTGEYVWTPAPNRFSWQAHLGDLQIGDENTSPYIVPARAKDLSGLPPTYLATVELDLFLEENIEYWKKLHASGVATELRVYPGGTHGVDLFGSSTKLGKRFIADYVDAIRRHLL